MAIPILTKKEAGKLQAAPHQEAQDQEALERQFRKVAGGLPYDRARRFERPQDGYRQGLQGFTSRALKAGIKGQG